MRNSDSKSGETWGVERAKGKKSVVDNYDCFNSMSTRPCKAGYTAYGAAKHLFPQSKIRLYGRTDGWTNEWTEGPKDIPSYRDAS